MKKNTQTKNAEPVEGFTGGEWKPFGTSVYASNNHLESMGKLLVDFLGMPAVTTKEEAEANAALIAAAPELFQMVKDLKNCIKRLTQDNLPQFERDTEAQWEGEAHELLTRINPNYYRNANEVNQ